MQKNILAYMAHISYVRTKNPFRLNDKTFDGSLLSRHINTFKLLLKYLISSRKVEKISLQHYLLDCDNISFSKKGNSIKNALSCLHRCYFFTFFYSSFNIFNLNSCSSFFKVHHSKSILFHKFILLCSYIKLLRKICSSIKFPVTYFPRQRT